MATAQYKAIAEKLIAKAFPQGDLNYMKTVVAADAVTHRAGFAALYGATGAIIPEKVNLLEWVEKASRNYRQRWARKPCPSAMWLRKAIRSCCNTT